MKNLIYLLLAFLPLQLAAHGGDEHDHNEQPKTAARNYFSTEAVSDKYEVLLRYAPLHPGEAGHVEIFLSDFLTNRAIDSATIRLSSPDDPTLKFEVHRDQDGIYSAEATFPEKKKYRINVNIDSPHGADLLALEGIDVGKELEAEAAEPKSWMDNAWLLFALGTGCGLALMFLIMKAGRKTKATSLLVIFLVGLVPNGSSRLSAHGDGHEGSENTNFSNTIYIPKESQFLFDMLTYKMETGDFTESVSLYGTVVPSSNGQALVQPSQSGNIYSLNVNVGQKVNKGQLLAILEPAMDAASVVNFAAERNNVLAEYDAAKKDYDRLLSLKDIVAKQDIDEALARLQKAEENKKLFNNLSGGATDPSRLIYLRSPIEGIVENFTMSVGVTVTAGTTLFTITNLSKVYIEAQVFDKDAHQIEGGGRFTVECTNDNHQTGEVHLLSMAQSINPTNQSQRVLFEMDNPDGEFKIGEFVNVHVFAKEPSREIAVPNSAISEINGRPVVFIKDAAEQYSVSYIQPGEDNGEFTVILKGVEENERVVVNASYQAKMIYLNQ
ncbi:MAG TPA: efflux RND transporter periplasmic adaptor subunit [Bacteroidia bacterium]|nr:efflux RND transporter periplasmic adaptor subunit [Bacteroidia bacterium]